MVRQSFHGAIAGPDRRSPRYGYSLAGLLIAIGLLVAGIRLTDKALPPRRPDPAHRPS